MTIQYLGHSCFLFEDGKGFRVVTDPYDGVGYPLPRVRADAVTVSHAHFDHCNVGGVDGDPVVLSRAGTFRVGDTDFEAIPCFHDGEGGRRRGSNLIFRFTLGGISVAHLGDLGEQPQPKLIEALRGTDLLLIPVGGNYTIDARTAGEYVRQISPRAVIPMHYKTEKLTIDVSPVDPFLRLFSEDKRAEIVHAGSTVELLPGDTGAGVRIIVMEREQA